MTQQQGGMPTPAEAIAEPHHGHTAVLCLHSTPHQLCAIHTGTGHTVTKDSSTMESMHPKSTCGYETWHHAACPTMPATTPQQLAGDTQQSERACMPPTLLLLLLSVMPAWLRTLLSVQHPNSCTTSYFPAAGLERCIPEGPHTLTHTALAFLRHSITSCCRSKCGWAHNTQTKNVTTQSGIGCCMAMQRGMIPLAAQTSTLGGAEVPGCCTQAHTRPSAT